MEENKIGMAIKKYREKANMSQTQLAEAIGLNSKDIISKYERGDRVPTIEKTLPKICEALNIDFDIIFKPKPKPKK